MRSAMWNKTTNATFWDQQLYNFREQWLWESALNYFYICVMLTFAIFGTMANLIVIVTLLILPELHKTEYAFVGNLAAADLMVTSIIVPVNVFVTIRGPEIFRDHPWFCELDGTICASACAGSIWCIMAISVERYICICHHPTYQRMFTPLRTALIIVGLWVIAHGIHLPNFLGWGTTGYSGDLYLCTAALGFWSYSIFYGVTAILLPIGISFYAYLRIYLRVRVSRAGRKYITGKGQHSDLADPHSKRQSTKVQQEVKLLKALFKLFLIFLASWWMMSVLFVGKTWISFPKWYGYLGLILAHGSSATNSVTYFWMTGLWQTTTSGYIRLFRQLSKQTRIGPHR